MAISNNRIEDVDETSVEFRYTPSGTKTVKRRRVSGQEFVRGFLQHTLPPNFHRIRYYGFLSQNSKLSLDRVRMLVWFYLGWCYVLARRYIPPTILRSPASGLQPPAQHDASGGDDRSARACVVSSSAARPQPAVSGFRVSRLLVAKLA